jgi:pimeloyl-ACP methyl ester carboxylesterase
MVNRIVYTNFAGLRRHGCESPEPRPSLVVMDLQPRLAHVLGLNPGGFHRIAYVEWGEAYAERIAVCVHGLTRQGRDFDVLARALAAKRFRVVCPDVAGRGLSDRLPDPKHYAAPQYLADMAVLIARLQVDRLDWIGTSMGGLIGLLLAAQSNTPVRRLVLNDIGPFVAKAALQNIAAYLGTDPLFSDLAAAEAYVRDVHSGFGPLSDEGWRHLALHGVRPEPGGGYRLRYDPALAGPFRASAETDADLWAVWAKVRVPVLVLRGEMSEVLSAETARLMAAGGPDGAGPKAEVVSFSGVGHAPALMNAEQVAKVADWLETGKTNRPKI